MDARRDDDVALALRLADEAASIALRHFAGGVTAETKGDGTPVTAADLDVERRLVDRLQTERPDDAILSEEAGRIGDGRRCWIIDPVDGTLNFVKGNDEWGTHVALEDDGKVVLGVITRPARRLRWWAARGLGAHREDRHDGTTTRLQVSKRDDLASSHVSVWSHQGDPVAGRLRAACVPVRPAIDNILQLVQGEIDAVAIIAGGMAEPWDHAPAVVLVTEARGAFHDGHGGRRLDLGTGISTNQLLDGQLQAHLPDCRLS
ncbi:MAG TPA: inositol monophosphatase family protein [Acidimicrobiales bacterium]